MGIIFFDFETGGLDPKRNPPLQLAWIIQQRGEIVSEKCFDIKPMPDTELSLQALEVNNFTLDRMKQGRELSYVMSAFVQDMRANMKGSSLFTLCGHNVHFDIGFLTRAADLTKEPIRNHLSLSNALDTCAIARWFTYREKIRPQNHKLTTLAAYFNIPINAHDALGDVRATRLVLKRFLELDDYLLLTKEDFEPVRAPKDSPELQALSAEVNHKP